jgi:hypothetical protein
VTAPYACPPAQLAFDDVAPEPDATTTPAKWVTDCHPNLSIVGIEWWAFIDQGDTITFGPLSGPRVALTPDQLRTIAAHCLRSADRQERRYTPDRTPPHIKDTP